MNKIFNCSLKIQGKGVEELVFCELKYHSDTISTCQIDRYESILEKVFQLVVKKFSQKPNLCKFEIKGTQIEFSLDDLEKELLESGLNLAEFTLNHEDIRFKFSNESEYPNHIANAMKSYYTSHYVDLCGIDQTKRFLQIVAPGDDAEFQKFKSRLRNLLDNFEKLSEEACEAFIDGDKLLKQCESVANQVEDLKDEYNF